MNRIALRKAQLDDAQVLRKTIGCSARELRYGFYTAEMMEAALAGPLDLDTLLIEDGTYFLAEIDDEVAGCGGWSRRRTLCGSDHAVDRDCGVSTGC